MGRRKTSGEFVAHANPQVPLDLVQQRWNLEDPDERELGELRRMKFSDAERRQLSPAIASSLSERWRPFEQARSWARQTEARTFKDWRALAASGAVPSDIPKAPEVAYAEFQGWRDFLGDKKKWLPFEEARSQAQASGVRTSAEWQRTPPPKGVPKHPDVHYRGKGWSGWRDFLGTDKRGNPGEFAPHKANPYVPGSEQPDMFAPIDTPRYVSMEELWTERARELVALYDDPEVRDTADIERRLAKEPVAAIGRDAYSEAEWDDLPGAVQHVIHERTEPSKTRIAEMVEAIAKDVQKLPDEYAASESAQWYFNDADRSWIADNYQGEIQATADEHGLDFDDVASQFANLISDDDYWGDIEEGDYGDESYRDEEYPVELEHTFAAFVSTKPTRDEFEAAIEQFNDDPGMPSDYSISASDFIDLNDFYGGGWRRVARYAPEVYVSLPYTFHRNVRWHSLWEALNEWAAEEAGEEDEDEDEDDEDDDEDGEEDEDEVRRGEEAELLAEQRRQEEAERARQQAAERQDALQQRILTYVRTGLPWDERIVYTYPDGTYIVKLDSFVELRMESEYLRHCVGKSITLDEPGSHWWPEYFVDELVDIYSMRPPGYQTMGKHTKRKASFLTIAVWRMGSHEARAHSTRIGEEIGRTDPTDPNHPPMWCLPGLNYGSFVAGRVGDIRGFDNRPAGFTKRENQGTRGFNLDETQKLLEWWVFGAGYGGSVQMMLAISGGTGDMLSAMAERVGRQPGRRTTSEHAAAYLDRHVDQFLALDYDPLEGAREFFEEGDWPRENPKRHGHVCTGEGFCAPPWCGGER